MGWRKWGVGGIIGLVCGCPSVRLSIYNVWVCVCVSTSLFLSLCPCTSVRGLVLVGRVYVEPQNAAQHNESV